MVTFSGRMDLKKCYNITDIYLDVVIKSGSEFSYMSNYSYAYIKKVAFIILGITCASVYADNLSVDSSVRTHQLEVEENLNYRSTKLNFRKLSVVEISSGKLYVFQFGTKYSLKEMKSASSFIGIKKKDKIVDLYVDSRDIPLNIRNDLSKVVSSMPTSERFRIGQMIHPKLLEFSEDKDAITVKFNSLSVEIGSAD